VATLLICRFVFLWNRRHNTLDLHLHDTYFVFSAASIIVPLFLLLTFAFYFIKEIRNRFSRMFPNIILIAAGMLLVILLVFVNKEILLLGSSSGGWTMYPPLSGLPPQVEPGRVEMDPLISVITNAFTVLQVLVTGALLYAAFHWGRHTQSRTMILQKKEN